ncbi:flagellar assembly peptidoglycan hydrolase FlgJ [Acidovorax sp. SRB_24]|uniref:flagellar assembly peptidoglycan hydrolase FlgJ n=1 Tax=Acidovorax sp. SRB_24 TaxID=1962700 RepID=UPI00145E273F|nr:flagellar assembly peptidoglycan hydrolase FlgJ [Acidovorax sp. SRB_24]NMM76297.1 flagellar rod assembly protein/muramidase FlgJ [Acidovorax sp. SRB_24]NMM76389.1 flagellar rod assembly protein/muramidase FlgJ [Acidovorax sp. SRB_24]
MLRPDIALGSTTASSWSTLQPALGGTGNFAAAFQRVHADIKQVIEHGWPDEAWPALRPEAQIHRLNSAQPSTALGDAVSSESPQAFLAAIAPWARQAAQSLGVSTELVAAHAALESGWGQRQLRDASGHTTHNLFGLKAQAGWQGERAEALTTEYEDGVAVKKTEGFRSYPDYASAFDDYARLLQSSPRYRAALNTGSDAQAFAQALARGGYATDPAYAAKLGRVASQIQSLD